MLVASVVLVAWSASAAFHSNSPHVAPCKPCKHSCLSAVTQFRCVSPCRELASLSMTPSAAVMAGNLKFTNIGLESNEAGSSQAAAAAAAPDAAPAAGTTT